MVGFRSRLQSNLKYPVKDDSPESLWNDLNLTTALRILAHSDTPNPMRGISDPREQLQALIDALCNLSVHDGLTGLVNATFFQATLTSELDRSSRTGRPCGLLMIDLDHFKDINDNYGHHIGDFVLQSVAHQLKHSLRSMDTAARIGGEEFAVILPECTPEDALRAARRIHGTLNPLQVDTGDVVLQVTASAGLVWTASRQTIDTSSLVAKADQQLYKAKRSGRRRLCHPHLSSTLVSTEERAALVLSQLEEELHGS
jgi:diguanylate cyclase (GGDEF)-like protein